MNDETAREKLAVGLCRAAHPDVQSGCTPILDSREPRWAVPACYACQRLADALFPVVRKIAAEELREAAEHVESMAAYFVPEYGTHAGGHRGAAHLVRDRADELHTAGQQS